MRILDKHVTAEFLKSFLATLCVFLFLFLIIDSFTNLDDFIRKSIAFDIIKRYYINIIPTVFVQTAPIACLLAMVYTMGKLNYNNELIAMRSGGLSIFKIVAPIFSIGVILTLTTFIVSEKIVPEAQEISDETKDTYIEQKEVSKGIYTNMAIYGLSNRQFFINQFDATLNTVEKMTILEHDRHQNVVKKLYVPFAKWEDGHWRAPQCFTYTFDDLNRLTGNDLETSYVLPIQETPLDFLRQQRKISYLNSRDLRKYIKRLSDSGAETAIRNLTIDLYQKLVSPLSCLIMIFIGLPCSMIIRRKTVGFSSIGISFFVALLYYVVHAISIALGKSNVFPAVASVTITPIIFFISSLYLIFSSP